jgi:hypothetical protein
MVGNVYEKTDKVDWEVEIEPGRFRGAVSCGKPIRIRAIALELCIHRETCGSRIDKLVKLGYLERHHDSIWEEYSYWVADSYKDTSRLAPLRPVMERNVGFREDEPFTCPMCNETVEGWKRIIIHRKACEEKYMLCNRCGNHVLASEYGKHGMECRGEEGSNV